LFCVSPKEKMFGDNMRATAISHGAATIINAIATGKGAAFGIGLWTKATVELNKTGKIDAVITDHPKEDTKLLELCVKKTLSHFKIRGGAKIITESNIPIARGLKSSSTAANAAVLATVGAIAKGYGEIQEERLGKIRSEQVIEINGKIVTPVEIINIGVDAAIDAKVTITGAFDDASASFLSGFVVTDNKERKILRQGDMENLDVLIFVPERKTYTKNFKVKSTRVIANEVEIAWNEALKGNLYTALTLNGLLYSSALKENTKITLEALRAGAIASGLSGTGPAVVALSRNGTGKIKKAWKEFDGNIIETKINNERARVLK